MEIIKRLKEPTPSFWKKIQKIGIALGVIGVAIVAASVALPAAIVSLGSYFIVAGSITANVMLAYSK